MSPHAQLFGAYNYNCTPIAPPGTQAIIHSKPSTCDSWAAHGLDRWYHGPALESYRSCTCWINKAQCQQICDAVAFLPLHVALPVATPDNMILASLKGIVGALQQPNHVDMLPPIITNQNCIVLQQLMTILNPSSVSHNLDIDVHMSPLQLLHPVFAYAACTISECGK